MTPLEAHFLQRACDFLKEQRVAPGGLYSIKYGPLLIEIEIMRPVTAEDVNEPIWFRADEMPPVAPGGAHILAFPPKELQTKRYKPGDTHPYDPSP